MRVNYKFTDPLKIHTSTDVEEIKEINIDLDELTIKDLIEIEKRYNKIIDGSAAPIIQRDYTSSYHTAVLEIILKKQYPHLLITSRDIENIKGVDARNLLFSIKSLYLHTSLEDQLNTVELMMGDEL